MFACLILASLVSGARKAVKVDSQHLEGSFLEENQNTKGCCFHMSDKLDILTREEVTLEECDADNEFWGTSCPPHKKAAVSSALHHIKRKDKGGLLHKDISSLVETVHKTLSENGCDLALVSKAFALVEKTETLTGHKAYDSSKDEFQNMPCGKLMRILTVLQSSIKLVAPAVFIEGKSSGSWWGKKKPPGEETPFPTPQPIPPAPPTPFPADRFTIGPSSLSGPCPGVQSSIQSTVFGDSTQRVTWCTTWCCNAEDTMRCQSNTTDVNSINVHGVPCCTGPLSTPAFTQGIEVKYLPNELIPGVSFLACGENGDCPLGTECLNVNLTAIEVQSELARPVQTAGRGGGLDRFNPSDLNCDDRGTFNDEWCREQDSAEFTLGVRDSDSRAYCRPYTPTTLSMYPVDGFMCVTKTKDFYALWEKTNHTSTWPFLSQIQLS
ncbi:hypothetical protein AAMO2058_000017900 [Amorphochlora amoebiformis]